MTFPTKTYEVIVTIRYDAFRAPASRFEFYAYNANDAIKQARREVKSNGYTRQDGPVEYRARRVH